MSLSVDNGGSAITSYQLDWDSGSNGLVWTDLVGLSTPYLGSSFTKTGLTMGIRYKFRLRA